MERLVWKNIYKNHRTLFTAKVDDKFLTVWQQPGCYIYANWDGTITHNKKIIYSEVFDTPTRACIALEKIVLDKKPIPSSWCKNHNKSCERCKSHNKCILKKEIFENEKD